MSFQKAQVHSPLFREPPKLTPSDKVPDGPLCGNGDIGVAGTASPFLGTVDFYLGKNDLWNSHSHWEEPGARGYGHLRFSLGGAPYTHYAASQDLSKAELTFLLANRICSLEITCTVLRKTNLVINRIHCLQGTANVQVSLSLLGLNEEVTAAVTTDGASVSACKKYIAPKYQWPLEAYSTTRVLEKSSLAFCLSENEGATVITALYTNQDCADPEKAASAAVQEASDETLPALYGKHYSWWQSFWDKSSVKIPSQPLAERYWYGSLYLMACCCEEGKFAPGLFGNWITSDRPAWGGDYHLNYNYEAPFWGLFSSNHVELTEPYDRPLLEYIPTAEKAAREKLGCGGLYMLVGIGPKGLRTSALTDHDGNDDVNYWGQKSNAAYAAVNMLMRFYSTYDKAYALDTAFPFLEKAARFWLDYLVLENGRYVVKNDCIYENQAAAIGVFDWADENTQDDGGDENPLITLGLLRALFRGLLDICAEFGMEHPDAACWQHVLENLSPFPTMKRCGQRVFRYTEKGTEWGENNSLGIQQIYPAGCVGLSSEASLLQTARNTFRQMARWEDYNAFPTFYPAGARLGIEPQVLLDHMAAQLKAHGMKNLFVFFGGGGIECCSAVPACINEMLLQSHEGKLRLFPVWNLEQEASFQKLRAYGAFLVSACLQDGMIQDAEIYSEKGRECHVCLPYQADTVVLNGERVCASALGSMEFRFETEPGATYRLQISKA